MNDWTTMSADRHDNNTANVREFQEFANAKFSFLWGGHGIKEDGIFGKMTTMAAMNVQKHLLLVPDGIIGPISIHWFKQYRTHNRIVLNAGKPGTDPIWAIGRYWDKVGGFIPGGGLSWTSGFGGPNDSDDNMYGQAYIHSEPTPAILASHNPDLIDMGILRSNIMTMGSFPKVKFFNKKDADGNQIYVTASTSWALNPKGFYCALRTAGPFGMYDEENPKVLVINPKNGKMVVCLRTDHGPSALLGTPEYPGTKPRGIDLSYGAMDALEAEPDDGISITTDRDRVIYAWASPDSELGYVGDIDYKLM